MGDMSIDDRFPSNPRSAGITERAASNIVNRQRSNTPSQIGGRPLRHHELGQTYDFEENKAVIGDNEMNNPVYDSSDGPVSKGGREIAAARGKVADVFVSGESFGGQPGFKAANVIKSGKQNRETIGENFLEDDDSDLDESGEIDPRLFM